MLLLLLLLLLLQEDATRRAVAETNAASAIKEMMDIKSEHDAARAEYERVSLLVAACEFNR